MIWYNKETVDGAINHRQELFLEIAGHTTWWFFEI